MRRTSLRWSAGIGNPGLCQWQHASRPPKPEQSVGGLGSRTRLIRWYQRKEPCLRLGSFPGGALRERSPKPDPSRQCRPRGLGERAIHAPRLAKASVQAIAAEGRWAVRQFPVRYSAADQNAGVVLWAPRYVQLYLW